VTVRGDSSARARTGHALTASCLGAPLRGAGIAACGEDRPTAAACPADASFGMFTVAGSVANPNGFDVGMIKAIDNTNGGTIPENCTGP
jgi:hypothetical protein